MAKWMDRIQDIFGKGIPVQSIPAGIYHFQSPPDTDSPYRLHLRLEKDGRGLLIINAHTTLHLNQTAAEFAYYLVQGYNEEKAVAEITRRYNIKTDQAKEDYLDILEKIKTLIQTQDLEPENYLSIDSQEPYSEEISAPYRLDCGLTYKVNSPDLKSVAPLERVKRELLTEEWRSILTKAWNAGIPHIVFTGGEPTLRPDLAELLAHCQSLGQVTGLLTDGLRLSDHEYLHSLLNEGLDHIMILHDPKDEQSWEAIKDVLVEDIFLTVHLTITMYDQSQVFATIDRLEKMGVKNLSLSGKSIQDGTGLKESSDFATSKGLNLVWDIPVPYSAFNPFNLGLENIIQAKGEGYAWLYIEPDGDVLPSQGVNIVLGNMLTDDWASIWDKRNKPKAAN
jgi:organic radical activating enzyme